MACRKFQATSREVWRLVADQHGVITRGQLSALGYSRQAIHQRLQTGRLHPVHRGVYAVGRPRLTQHGRWMAAVLARGADAVLSHRSAAALWDIASGEGPAIEVVVPAGTKHKRPGILVHRRVWMEDADRTSHHGIAVTTPVFTLIDLASTIESARALDTAVNEADKRGLVDPQTLRAALDDLPPLAGLGTLVVALAGPGGGRPRAGDGGGEERRRREQR